MISGTSQPMLNANCGVRRIQRSQAEGCSQRFGRTAELAARMVAYCDEQGDLDDVRAICEPLAVRARADDNESPAAPRAVVGVVYLMRSGKHYKIGRSNAVGRRHYELTIQLPERLELVHAIGRTTWKASSGTGIAVSPTGAPTVSGSPSRKPMSPPSGGVGCSCNRAHVADSPPNKASPIALAASRCIVGVTWLYRLRNSTGSAWPSRSAATFGATPASSISVALV